MVAKLLLYHMTGTRSISNVPLTRAHTVHSDHTRTPEISERELAPSRRISRKPFRSGESRVISGYFGIHLRLHATLHAVAIHTVAPGGVVGSVGNAVLG